MISDTTIQQVFQSSDIVEVIGDFLELKRTGANYKAKSPFTEEKTPSFVVSPAKQIFKDFSTGIGGGVIKFLEEHKNMTFPEAIEYLAQKYNIEIRKEGKEMSPEKVDNIATMKKVAKAAAAQYAKQLKDLDVNSDVTLELHENRVLSGDAIYQWQIGYAPKSWSFIKDLVTPKGLFYPAQDLGLVASKNDKNYDVLRNRIIFPIHDHRGEIVAFGGRAMGDEQPKYLNSPNSDIYNKSRVLYGLHFAQHAIRKAGFVYLTEGYYDVISMHESNCENTVATCGTGFTDLHAKLLRHYTDRVVILYDGDEPGQKAAKNAIPVLLKAGFQIEVATLPDNKDPDDFAREFRTQTQEEPTEQPKEEQPQNA